MDVSILIAELEKVRGKIATTTDPESLAKLNAKADKYSVDIYSASPTAFYNSSFFRKRASKMHEWEKHLGYDIGSRYQIKSMVDFGCGLGSFLEGVLDAGAKTVQGFDISYKKAREYISDRMKNFIAYGNVGEPMNVGKFDCVLCVEVAEHILPKQSDMLVKNLSEAAERMIFFTSAPPGQPGTGHINCQKQSYWLKRFANYGWVRSKSATKETNVKWCEILRDMFEKKPPVYVAKNLMVLVRDETIH